MVTSRLYLCRAEHGTAGLSSAQAGTPLTSAKSPTRMARKELGLPLVASSSRTKLWLALAKSANTQPLQRRIISSAVAPKAVAPALSSASRTTPQVPLPHGVCSTPPALNTRPAVPAQLQLDTPCAARAVADAASSAAEILFRRQPRVPIDLERGQLGMPALASFHADRSQRATALAPVGGGCRLRGG